jgi:hypothetical protein
MLMTGLFFWGFCLFKKKCSKCSQSIADLKKII